MSIRNDSNGQNTKRLGGVKRLEKNSVAPVLCWARATATLRRHSSGDAAGAAWVVLVLTASE
jgi:hypothetical protein